MKQLFWIAAAFLTFGAHAAPTTKGRVVCSISQPRLVGFELTKYSMKDKTYRGEFVNLDYVVAGQYQPVERRLDIEVSSIDEDGEALSKFFSLSARLEYGKSLRLEFLKPATEASPKEQLIELYCNFAQYQP